MRIPFNAIGQRSIWSMQDNLGRMESLRQQISSGLTINRLSDDPAILDSFLTLRSGMTRIGHYTGMIDQRVGRYERTETALAGVADVFAHAEELALQAKNGTMSDEDRDAVAGEIDSLIDQLVALANASRGLTGSTEQLYTRSGDVVTLDGTITPASGASIASVDPWMTILAQETGETIDWENVFGTSTHQLADPNDPDSWVPTGVTANDNMFQALFDLKDALTGNDPEAIGTALDNVQAHFNTAVNERAQVGNRINNLTTVKGQLGMQDDSLAKSVNELAGTRIEDALILLTEQQMVYEATLGVTSRMLQVSLLNFLK